MIYEVEVIVDSPSVTYRIEADSEEEAEQEVVAHLNHKTLWFDVFNCHFDTIQFHNEGDTSIDEDQ